MPVTQPFLANALMNHIFRASAYTMPTQLNLALFVGVTEVSGGAYARINVIGSSNWTSPSSGLISNAVAINFATATAAWGVVDHYGIYDQSGNLLYFDALTTSRTINSGDGFGFAIGELQLQQE